MNEEELTNNKPLTSEELYEVIKANFSKEQELSSKDLIKSLEDEQLKINTCSCGVVNEFPRRGLETFHQYVCSDCIAKEEEQLLDNRVNELLGDYLSKHEETKITVRDLRAILKTLLKQDSSISKQLSELRSRTSGLIVYGAHKHT